MPGGNCSSYPRGRQGLDRTLGGTRQALGKRTGSERGGYAQRSSDGSSHSFRGNGCSRKRKSSPISEICAGNYTRLHQRTQLPATTEIARSQPDWNSFIFTSSIFRISALFPAFHKPAN